MQDQVPGTQHPVAQLPDAHPADDGHDGGVEREHIAGKVLCSAPCSAKHRFVHGGD